jgi:hypothetical protein
MTFFSLHWPNNCAQRNSLQGTQREIKGFANFAQNFANFAVSGFINPNKTNFISL